MPDLTPLVPNGDVTTTNLLLWDRTAGAWVESATTGSFAHIDEAVGTIANGDTAVAPTQDHNTTVTVTFELSSVDGDFSSMDTLSFHCDTDIFNSGALGGDTGFFEIRVSNAGDTVDFVSTTRLHTWNGSAWSDDAPQANFTKSLTLTANGQSAGASEWNGARLHVTFNNNRDKGPDGSFPIILVDCELTGTYTASSGPISRSVSDILGATDEDSESVAWGRVRTDFVGVDDPTLLRDANALRNISDLVGVFDPYLARGGDANIPFPAENLGLVDDLFRSSDLLRAISDFLGLLDEIIAALPSGGETKTATVSDFLGLLDERSRASDLLRALEDFAGLLDDESHVSDLLRVTSDLLGVLDDLSQSSTLFRSVSDLLGVLDEITTEVSAGGVFSLTLSDIAGLLDDESHDSLLLRAIQDILGLLDPEILQSGVTEVPFQADYLGLIDDTAAGRLLIAAISDFLGVLDSQVADLIEGLPFLSLSVEDLLGVIDQSPSFSFALGLSVSDLVGLLDLAVRQSDASRTTSDLFGILDDDASLSSDLLRSTSDLLGLFDPDPRRYGTVQTPFGPEFLGLLDALDESSSRTLGISISDLLGLLDAFDESSSRTFSVVISDLLGLLDNADASLFLGTLHTLLVTDFLGISDDLQRILHLFAEIFPCDTDIGRAGPCDTTPARQGPGSTGLARKGS